MVLSFVVSVPVVGSVTANDCSRSSPRGDLGQVALLLLRRAVPQQRAHDVHLRVARAGVGAGAVDLLEDDRGLGDAQPGAAVLLRDQRRQPAGLGQRLDELLRVGALLVQLAPILGRESRAQRPHRLPQFREFVPARSMAPCIMLSLRRSELPTPNGRGMLQWRRASRQPAPLTDARALFTSRHLCAAPYVLVRGSSRQTKKGWQ